MRCGASLKKKGRERKEKEKRESKRYRDECRGKVKRKLMKCGNSGADLPGMLVKYTFAAY